MGYRYFDSFNITPAYPFGFGGSYTTFALEVKDVALDGERRCASGVNVQNTGSRYAGRETVQVYLSQPQGKLDKPTRCWLLCQDRLPGPRPVRDGDRHLPAAYPGLLR